MHGRVSLTIKGAWTGSLTSDGTTAPTGKIKLVADGGFDLACAVVAGGVDHKNAVHLSIVGGAGGLGKEVIGSFRSAQLRDPLVKALGVSGDALSANVSAALLSQSLAFWTQGRHAVARELYALARAAAADVNWRYEADGALWIGAESWPSAELPSTARIVDVEPSLGRTIIAVDTPAILPGVDLVGVGKVRAVDHWIEHDHVRSIVWS